MAEDTTVTDRLRQLPDEPDDDLGGHTIIIDDTDVMATGELKELLEPVKRTEDNDDSDDAVNEWTWIS